MKTFKTFSLILFLGFFIDNELDCQISFQNHYEITTPTKVDFNLVGDFNNDLKNELIIPTGFYFNDTADYFLYLFKQNDKGEFICYNKVPYPKVYPGLSSIAKGDLNNDGLLDIVITYSDSIAVFYQGEDGLFTRRKSEFSGKTSQGLICGDINSDGLDDIIAGNYLEEYIRVFYQNGEGFLLDTIYYKVLSGRNVIKIADINNDGFNDAVISNGVVLPGGTDFYSFCIYLQDTITHKLLNPIVYTIQNTDYYHYMDGIDISDINNDGLPDIVTSQFENVYIWYQQEQNPYFFDLTPKILNAYMNPGAVSIVDLNKDNRKEIVLVNNGWSCISVYECDSLYNYETYNTFNVLNSPNLYQQGISICDLNEDGLPDISVSFWTGGPGGVSNLINDSKVGQIDLVSKEYFQNKLNVYPNPGDGTFTLTSLNSLDYPVRISVINMKGQVVYNDVLEWPDNEINIENVTEGFYILNITCQDNHNHALKILIKNIH